MGSRVRAVPGITLEQTRTFGQDEESDKTYRVHFVGLPLRGLLRTLPQKWPQVHPEPPHRDLVVQGSQDHERVPAPQVYIFTSQWEVEISILILCHGVVFLHSQSSP